MDRATTRPLCNALSSAQAKKIQRPLALGYCPISKLKVIASGSLPMHFGRDEYHCLAGWFKSVLLQV